MAQSKSKIDYKTGNGYSHTEILALAEYFIENATTDLEYLIPFGFTQEFLDELVKLVKELESTPTEQKDLDKKTQTTRHKQELVTLARKESIRIQKQLQFYHKYINVYTSNQPSSKKNINAMTEKDIIAHLIELSSEFVVITEEYQEYGIKPEKAAELLELREQILNAKAEKSVTYKLCHLNAINRSELKYKIYAICKHISVLGKLYWKEIDSFRYKKYLITKPTKKGRKAGSTSRLSE